jgi:hypothetical protein
MKLWRGQPDNWRPQPLPRGRHIGAIPSLAAMFVYFAFQSFIHQGPCRARSFTCRAAESWASVFELPIGTAMAHIWLLFAWIFVVLAFVSAPRRR